MHIKGDANWEASYRKAENLWWANYVPGRFPNIKLQCFSVPLTTDDGQRIGMVCTMVLEQLLVDMVRMSKTRPDIDLSIYDAEGQCIVAPADYIRQYRDMKRSFHAAILSFSTSRQSTT